MSFLKCISVNSFCQFEFPSVKNKPNVYNNMKVYCNIFMQILVQCLSLSLYLSWTEECLLSVSSPLNIHLNTVWLQYHCWPAGSSKQPLIKPTFPIKQSAQLIIKAQVGVIAQIKVLLPVFMLSVDKCFQCWCSVRADIITMKEEKHIVLFGVEGKVKILLVSSEISHHLNKTLSKPNSGLNLQ